ncbi:DNA repair metallo-beta-lactamase-domain-containing protein [Aspergillus ambiguus]|uniref:DNA cross-link repair protein PSO2 n=1 Tax=Aspergillus ambiguus TaxID=176160 RepID=UPI003CCCB140
MAGFFQKKMSTPAKSRPGTKSQGSAKRNSSLLNFFQKADGPPQATSRQPRITQFVTKSDRSPGSGSSSPYFRKESSSAASNSASGLFLDDPRGAKALSTKETPRARSLTPDDIWGEDGDGGQMEDARYNENGSSVKRRKVDSPEAREVDAPANNDTPAPVKRRAVSGPFIDESDSEDDVENTGFGEPNSTTEESAVPQDCPEDATRPSDIAVPPLVREATSHFEDDEYPDFDDIDEDECDGERELLEDPCEDRPEDVIFGFDDSTDALDIEAGNVESGGEGLSCPVCQTGLSGLNETDASQHVNDCLDGKPQRESITAREPVPQPATARDLAAVPRAAQKDPYFGPSKPNSAFSRLMAGNAEDTAWAEAAANEVATRGKQAYQRTCPFYKIVTGFSLCVDAFRYGAVDGCSAYFLSHFHSDHYVGLTSSWRHGPIYCSRPTANLVRQQLKVDARWLVGLEFEKKTEVPGTGGVQVTLIEANHCPGSALFLFEKPMGSGSGSRVQRVLHCGDFRASAAQVNHQLLRPEIVDSRTGQKRPQRIDVCYLDTTYLNPKYGFPTQAAVIQACADLSVRLDQGSEEGGMSWLAGGLNGMMGKFLSSGKSNEAGSRSTGRLLVVIGTYSIGKERICLGIARALKSKIYAPPAKQRICACLEDEELSSLLTDNPREAQVHMQTLFEIRAETLTDYLDSLKPHFTRVVGFRPTGWSYRPPKGRELENPPVSTVLHSAQWQTPFTARDLVAQRGSTSESACFGVPYSEHSSFRELTMFCCALRIGRVIPTVNVGSRKSRERMKAWIDRWEAEKRKSGLYRGDGWG